MLEITARDVVGTAQVNAALAAARLQALLDYEPSDPVKHLQEIARLLTKAKNDIFLAECQLSPDWEDAIYLGIWANPKI